MSTLARLYDFAPGTPIASGEVDAEFNQIVNALNSTSTNINVILRFTDATVAPLKLDQLGAGPIQQWSQAGVVKASIANSGQFLSAVSTGTAPISVTSTTVCTNLNADLLDGKGLFAGDAVGILQGLNPIFSTAGNSAGSGDSDLHQRILSANTLDANGATLHVVMGGRVGSNANAKRIRVLFGGTAVLDTGSLTSLNNTFWKINLTIIRIDSDSIKAISEFTTQSGTTQSFASYVQVNSLDFTDFLTLKVVANGVAANDVVQEITTFNLCQTLPA